MKITKKAVSIVLIVFSVLALLCSCAKKEEKNYKGITSEYWLPVSYVKRGSDGEVDCSIEYTFDENGLYLHAGCHMGKDVLDSKIHTTYDAEEGKMDVFLNEKITYTIEFLGDGTYCLNLHGKEVLDFEEDAFEKFMMLNSDGTLRKLDEKKGYSATAEMQENGSVLLKETLFDVTTETVLVPASKEAMVELIALNKLYGVAPDYWYFVELDV